MEIVLGVPTTAKPPFPSTSPFSRTPKAASSLFIPLPRTHFRSFSLLQLPPSTVVSLFSLLSPLHEAKALTLPKDQLVSTITEVERTLDDIQEVGLGFLDNALHAFEVVANALKPSVDATLPILSRAGEQVVQLASPPLSDALKKAQEAIQNSGFDTKPVLNAAKTAADVAQHTTKIIVEVKPMTVSIVETISAADPITIVGSAGVLYVTYLVLPTIWSAISFNLRGYKGELTAAQALDLISTKNCLVIDIRSEKDKSKTGVPRLPPGANKKLVAIPLEELPSKLKGLVRNVKKVEAEMVALKISYLKKLSKGSDIVIMDSNSDSAKIVAKALTSFGCKNCWVVADGFSGRRGWLQSGLGAESYKISFAEVLSPYQIIPAAARRFGTTTASIGPPARKLLP